MGKVKSIRPLFIDLLFFISACMYFYCCIYFSIITDLAIICVKFNMQIEGNFAHAQLGFQGGCADTVATSCTVKSPINV